MILDEAKQLQGELKALKDRLHRIAELSFEEYETTGIIREGLAELGLEPVELPMPTGAVVLLRGGSPGKTVMLRADIDAILQQEPEGAAVVSEHPGRMHACGHDFHTACLMGAATLLARRRESLRGNVVFLFQTAEEVTQGAAAMIAHGLFERLPKVDALFGLHNRPEIPVGSVGVKQGPLMAGKSNFEIILHGVAGHGGMPHKCVDVIVAAAAVINGIQTIVSRNADPFEPIVCAVCSIHGGDTASFITDRLTMTGELRTLSVPLHQLAEQRLRTLAEQTAQAYGCKVEINIIPKVPVLSNGDDMYRIAYRAAQAVMGQERIVSPEPCLASEDFAVLMEHAPGFFYWLGSGSPEGGNASWHSEHFATDDQALAYGAALLAQSALEIVW